MMEAKSAYYCSRRSQEPQLRLRKSGIWMSFSWTLLVGVRIEPTDDVEPGRVDGVGVEDGTR